MHSFALKILLLAIGVIVFEFAVLAQMKADEPWLKGLPALFTYLVFIGTLFLSVSRDQVLPTITRRSLEFINSKPNLFYLSTIITLIISLLFGLYLWKLYNQKDGAYVVHVVEKEDVPDQAKQGVPVQFDHKLKILRETLFTERDGIVSYKVNKEDVFAVRIKKSNNEKAPVFVVTSSAQLRDETKYNYNLVKWKNIPEEAWITKSHLAPERTETIDPNFAHIPSKFFYLPTSNTATSVMAGDNPIVFPFKLPDAEMVIYRDTYTVGFSPRLKLPRWVAYHILIYNREKESLVDRFSLRQIQQSL